MPIKDLGIAVVEKDVENAYRKAIKDNRPDATITSPHHTDGYAQWGTVRLLLEAKFDSDFKQRIPVCNTLGQCLMYLKKFEESGEPLPNVILVGDKNECFVLSSSAVKGFLDLPIDWSGAPSSGNPELTRALVERMNILPYVYDVDGNFKFKDVLEKIETLASGEQYAVKATPGNIGAIFLYWKDRVFTGSKLTPVEQVDVFLRCLFQPTEVFLHPTKRGVLMVSGYPDGVPVSPEQYQSFFDHFQQGYKPSEIEVFYSMKDRLVEDDARRRQGAFFTPALWVNEAHRYMDKVLGSTWREDCLVWDNSCGTGNLTRDYVFKDLILTTAEKPDVDVILEQGYNPGALVQQYDFLNPGVGSPFVADSEKNTLKDEIILKLRDATSKGKRLVFFMNPPYGTAGETSTKNTNNHKENIAATAINQDMKDAKLGAPSQQLYAQFMFRCARIAEDYGFRDYTVATFSVPTFMSSGSYKPFRNWWYGKHEFKAGMLFQASHFADVSGRWGISFTVWSSLEKTDSKKTVLLDVLSQENFGVKRIGEKVVYNSDDRDASKWVRKPLGKLEGIDCPQFSSGLTWTERPTARGSLAIGSLGYIVLFGNNLRDANDGTYPVSGTSSRCHGCSLIPSNFNRVIALYSARKLVLETWDTQKDEYLVPNEQHPDYTQWVNDCHIYALLHRSNNCTSMRQVSYKGTLWTIHNHFFWKSWKDTLEAFDTPATLALYKDCKNHPAKDVFGNPVVSTPDPYMAHVIADKAFSLSPDAQHVLDLLDALWVKSLPFRESYAAGKPELHLGSWDAGVYQLKHLFRDLFPEEWKELQTAHKALAERLKPGVYEFGFLLR